MSRYIDKEPIVEFITKGLNNPDKLKAFGYDAIEILTEIEYAPTADVAEVRHGYWKYVDGDLGYSDLECSECGAITAFFDDERFNYCPNCGAKMDGERKQE